MTKIWFAELNVEQHELTNRTRQNNNFATSDRPKFWNVTHFVSRYNILYNLENRLNVCLLLVAHKWNTLLNVAECIAVCIDYFLFSLRYEDVKRGSWKRGEDDCGDFNELARWLQWIRHGHRTCEQFSDCQIQRGGISEIVCFLKNWRELENHNIRYIVLY